MRTAVSRRPAFRAVLAVVLAAAAAPAVAAEEVKEKESDFWWWIRGFEITPGVGLRHLGVDIHSKSAGTQGNLSNSISSSAFASINVESPSYQFGKSNFGFSVYLYAANVNLNEQFVADPSQTDTSATASGQRDNVGTSLSGYYSYLVPALHYRLLGRDGSSMKFALGYGRWVGRFSGDVILTPDNRPANGMPKTPIDTRVSKNAYLFTMQYKFANHWQAYMSVGGPKWSDDNFRYQMEEVSLIVGYTFIL
jgi:hypothetical protein